MAKQQAKRHSKTAVHSKRTARSHRVSSHRHRKVAVKGLKDKGQKTATMVPNAIEFLEIDVVGPFEAGAETELSEVIAGQVDEF